MDPKERATAEALADAGNFAQYRKRQLTPARQMDRSFTTTNQIGTQDGEAGDYLCIDAKGEPYPCPKDVFEASYELAVPAADLPHHPV